MPGHRGATVAGGGTDERDVNSTYRQSIPRSLFTHCAALTDFQHGRSGTITGYSIH